MSAADEHNTCLHLFEGYGIELEYMIVDTGSLAVVPAADRVLRNADDRVVSDYPNGAIDWSNELVCHVIELKTHTPVPELTSCNESFPANIREINARLAAGGCRLLGGAVHPFMNPSEETRIWPYEYNEVYALYNRIFDCRGHGWANLQSTHINLPFCGDKEFAVLHAAIRIILPLIPALCAGSPVLEEKYTGFADSRLEIYRHNQAKIPSIAGDIIPEPVTTHAEYENTIFRPIRMDMAPYDPDHILDKHFLNSRGAIARFDRGSIEIRLLDIQEAPCVDLALCCFLITLVKSIVQEQWISYAEMRDFPQSILVDLLLKTIREAEQTVIRERALLQAFGISESSCAAGCLLGRLYEFLKPQLPAWCTTVMEDLLHHGSLATRLQRRLGARFGHPVILETYNELADCLQANRMWK